MNVRGASAQASPSDLLSWLSVPPPEAVRFPRKPLDQTLAVLLMRTSYDAVDQLDFIPMNDFQRQFWLLRQAEQESYALAYAPLKPRLGDLTDPLYFDFISFAQYAVIAREMPRGQLVFKEFCDDCPDQSLLVRRDPSLSDNAQLPARMALLVGDKLYDGLRYGFRGEQFGAPEPLSPSSSVQEVTQAVQQLLDILVSRGYALKAQVTPTQPEEAALQVAKEECSFRVSILGPANLWGLQALSYRRSPLLNSYDSLLIEAYLRASGFQSQHESSLQQVGVEQRWSVQPALAV